MNTSSSTSTNRLTQNIPTTGTSATENNSKVPPSNNTFGSLLQGIKKIFSGSSSVGNQRASEPPVDLREPRKPSDKLNTNGVSCLGDCFGGGSSSASSRGLKGNLGDVLKGNR